MKLRFALLSLVAIGTVALMGCGEAPSAPVAAPTPATVAETGGWSPLPGAGESGKDQQIAALEARIAELEGQTAQLQGQAGYSKAPGSSPGQALSAECAAVRKEVKGMGNRPLAKYYIESSGCATEFEKQAWREQRLRMGDRGQDWQARNGEEGARGYPPRDRKGLESGPLPRPVIE